MKTNVQVDNQTNLGTKNRFGFTEYAELLNGRLAMIGFVSAVLLEVLTGNTLIGFLTGL
jgi:Chlorophyll A-B binding protein